MLNITLMFYNNTIQRRARGERNIWNSSTTITVAHNGD